MDIFDLATLDWSKEERYGLVGHSFRVMAKARNYDEMVVGLMHACYAGSSTTRSLYSCDVDGDPEWKTALDMFVPSLKLKRFRAREEVPEEYLLNVNLPQGLSEAEREKWMLNETTWSRAYEDYIMSISRNRIARNVMIHKLKDMLDVLCNPGKYEAEFGKQYYVLPWKKHYRISILQGKRSYWSSTIPKTDDPILLRDPTDGERTNLIDKYQYALDLLEYAELRYAAGEVFTEEERQANEAVCHQRLQSWMEWDMLLHEMEDEGTGHEIEEYFL